MFIKDPDANLDYTQDWSAWMAPGDAIATSTWIVPDGLVGGVQTNTSNTATIWLSGGTSSTAYNGTVIPGIYNVVNRIFTTAGREDERTIVIQVQDR